MPMIDIYAPSDLFPTGSDRQLAQELTAALLRAEGVANPGPAHTNNTGAYVHRLPPGAVHTAATDSARTVRVQVITPPAALDARGPETVRQGGGGDRQQDLRRSHTGGPYLGAADRGR